MKEYQPANVFVGTVSGNCTLAPTATMNLLYSSNKCEMRSPVSTGSQFSSMTAASSTLSIVSQTQHCDWPEFQESYNSIMDNTNLLDDCAAALNDISQETLFTPRSERMRCEFNRSHSTISNSSLSGFENPVTPKCVKQFTQWLCNMENRVAAQPKLSKIVAMKPEQMDLQLEIHSKIFKEIVAQPCIIKGSKRTDYQLIEKRYHLLYLKVYEVLLLLEGSPANNLSPSNRILSQSFPNFECSSSVNDEKHFTDYIDGDNEFLNDSICDKTHSGFKTPNYTETNVLSTSIGTYYFNYDDTIEQQQTDNTVNGKLSSTIFEGCDKEFTIESNLHSLLNATDTLCLKSQDLALVSQETTQETVVVPEKNYFWSKLDYGELALQSVTTSNQQYYSSSDINSAHHKVYNWLHTKTDSWKSKSSINLDCSMNSDVNYQLLYRAKSEMDLSVFRPMETNNLTSSLRTSLNCLPSVISPMKCVESKCIESISEDNNSLIWDNFQTGNSFMKSDYDFGLIGNDLETRELSNKICFFGDDYSLHLIESSTSESEHISDMEAERGKKASKIIETSSSSQKDETKMKRNRRTRRKRSKADSEMPVSASIIVKSRSTQPSDRSSDLYLSEATTATPESEILNSTRIEDSQTTPMKSISYDNDQKQFELHTNESAEPKKLKISEMRPEHFYDIVKMCQSNIDCVITVLGAEPNRNLTVAYCQQMKFDRHQKSNETETCKCKQENADASDLMNSPRTKNTECNVNCIVKADSGHACICEWVCDTIAMILNFLIDWWNIFRNMKLYTYLCRVTKALFGSTRYVADHLKSKRAIVNVKSIKFS